MFLIEIIDSYDKFQELRLCWNSVLLKSAEKSVFLTWEWIKNWWDFFGKNDKLFIIVARNINNEVCCIAPLMIKKIILGTKIRSLEFLGSGEICPEDLCFLATLGDRHDFSIAVFEKILLNRNKWDIINLSEIKEDSFLYKEIFPRVNFGMRKKSIIKDVCPYITLPSTGGEYEARLSSSYRSNLKRKKRKVCNAQGEFFIIREEKFIDGFMNVLESLHRERMTEKGKNGFSIHHFFWEFHRKIARDFFKKGWLLLGGIKMDNKIVCCQYSFNFFKKTYYYQSGMSKEYSKYSLGNVLMSNMINESIAMKNKEFDFLRGKEKYKFFWTKEIRNNTAAIIWGDTFRAKIHYYINKVKLLLK